MLKVIKNDYAGWDLLVQVLSGEVPEQDPDFQRWLNENEAHKALYFSLKEESSLFDTDRMYRNISTQLFPEKKQGRLFRPWMAYASLLAVVLTLSLTWLSGGFTAKEPKAILAELPEPMQPGGKKARLVLPDGSTVELGDSFSMDSPQSIVNNKQEGELSYTSKRGATQEIEYHTLEVPIGGEYELKLSDGTHVFLNSGSTLRYPSAFAGNMRQVDLKGEAYFNVAKSTTRFIVRTDKVDIEVLGTMFNLSAYDQDATIATTLESGKVQLISKTDKRLYALEPGHQLNYDRTSGDVRKEAVDTDLYTSWRRGEFIFRNQALGEILTRLSRWYNFNISYEDESIRGMKFTGSAEKKRELHYVLRQIELVTNIKFKTEGQQVVAYREYYH